MHRRQLLLGTLCLLHVGACAPLIASSTRTPAADGESRAGAGRMGRPGIERPPSAGAVEVEVVEEAGALSRQTGYCDLDGVVTARGSRGLARQACDRDLQVEKELADGLRVSAASHAHAQGREQHLAGNTEQARIDYHEAIRRDNDGRSPSAVTNLARVNLGLLHHEQGEQATAQEHLQWVLDHSTEPAVRGAAYHNLSLVLLELDETEAALHAAEQGHRLLRSTLGASHGSVGASLNALGVIHAERGELDEAVHALQAAVETRIVALGEAHPATAASYTNLGVALGRRGEWDDALLAHREALLIDGVVLGPDHAVTAADHGHVGAALLELGQPRAARESFREALAILEPTRPVDDLEVERLRQWLRACDEADASSPHAVE